MINKAGSAFRRSCHNTQILKQRQKKRLAGLDVKITVIVALVATVTCFYGCAKKSGKTESIAEIQKREGIPVRTANITRGKLWSIESSSGTAEGIYEAVLSAGVPGTVSSIPVKVGSRVKKNSVVATVSPDMASPYTMAKTQYDNAKKALDRVKTLADEGAVPQETREQVEAGYTVAEEQLRAARRSEHIVTPFDGTVIEILQEKNSKVGPGQDLVRVARLDKMIVELTINESLINRFKTGQRAFILMDGDTLWGEVSQMAIGASEKTHAFPLTTVFDNSHGMIKSGMFLTVNVITEERDSVLSVSPENVVMEGGKSYVYVVRDGKAHRTELKFGIRGTVGFEVLEGLKEGERLITGGASLLGEGSKVKVIN